MPIRTLFEQVAAHAEHKGNRTAVARWRPGLGFEETSYCRLVAQALRFAEFFARHVPEGGFVPILAGRSADSIAAMLGALAVGRTFCFLNPKYRGPQIATVLDATQASSCVVDGAGLAALRGTWREFPQIAQVTWVLTREEGLTGVETAAASALRDVAKVVGLPSEGPAAKHPEPEGTISPTKGPAAAACLFTSGSTGVPKGVLVSAEDLSQRTEAEIAWFGISEEDVLLGILPFSFDVGLNQLLAALAAGAELVILDSWLPADIVAVTAKRRVTGISAVPSIWQDMMLAGAKFDTEGPHEALRYITVSGGSLPRRLLELLPGVTGRAQIFKTYGQTEAFRTTSLRPEDFYRKIDSVGRAFSGVHVYIVNEEGAPCGAGEFGEVVHTGLGVMVGYLNGDNQGKLRPNPFRGHHDSSPVAVFTGDEGMLDAEGYLHLRGRRDGMVKIKGNRVYPQEVANQILELERVRDVVVLGMTGEDGEPMLVAFVATTDGSAASPAALRKELLARLPAFMVPKRVVLIDRIPRGPSGKPDARRLVEWFSEAGEAAPL